MLRELGKDGCGCHGKSCSRPAWGPLAGEVLALSAPHPPNGCFVGLAIFGVDEAIEVF